MKLDRRGFVTGLGAAALAMPRLSFAAGVPKRLIVMFSPNGHQITGWPKGPGLAGTSLEPLTPHFADLIVTRGIEMRSCYKYPGADNSHYQGWAHCLTATQAIASGGHAVAGGPSFDMEAAKRIGGDTRFLYSLQGVNSEGNLSWPDRAVPVPAERSPQKVFDRLFAAFTTPPDQLARLRARRQSVLDYVAGSLGRASCRLGAEDRRKLDAHVFAIRDVEKRLARGASSGAQCRAPARPGAPAAQDPTAVPTASRLQIDLLVMAFACDLTRVGALQYFRAVSGGKPTWIGIDQDHHELTHQSTPDALDKVRRINRWYAGELAYLMSRLREVTQPDGSTLLDQTAIVWVSELGLNVNGHNRNDLGVVIAGRAGRRLKTGQVLELKGVAHNDLFVELLNAVSPDGMAPVTAFGDRSLCTGGIAALRA